MGLIEWIKYLFAPIKVRPTPLPRRPHPANVPGQFYVEKGCCISCGVPESEAPDLFGWADGENHCYVKKQPKTDAEMACMLAAMSIQEVDCIRARFCHAEFFERLKGAGDEGLVDRLPDDYVKA